MRGPELRELIDGLRMEAKVAAHRVRLCMEILMRPAPPVPDTVNQVEKRDLRIIARDIFEESRGCVAILRDFVGGVRVEDLPVGRIDAGETAVSPSGSRAAAREAHKVINDAVSWGHIAWFSRVSSGIGEGRYFRAVHDLISVPALAEIHRELADDDALEACAALLDDFQTLFDYAAVFEKWVDEM